MYSRGQTTLFSKALFMFPGSFTITYDPILTRSFPTSQPSKAPSKIEIKANLSIKQILLLSFLRSYFALFETFSNANSRIFIVLRPTRPLFLSRKSLFTTSFSPSFTSNKRYNWHCTFIISQCKNSDI